MDGFGKLPDVIGFTIPERKMVEIIPEGIKEVTIVGKEYAAEEGGGALEVVFEDFAEEGVFDVVGEEMPYIGCRMRDAGCGIG